MPGFNNGVVYADNVRFDGTQYPGQVTTDGQLLIGSTASPHIKVGTLATSAGQGLSITPSSGSINISGLNASTSVKGVVELATSSLTCQGTDTTTVTTPAGINSLKNYTDIVFNESPLAQLLSITGAVASGNSGATNNLMFQAGEILNEYMIATAPGADCLPVMDSIGLNMGWSLIQNNGAEFNWGMFTKSKHAYTIGTSPAFFLEFSINATDVTDSPILCGFRKQQVCDPDYTTYTDYAFIGLDAVINPGTMIIEDRLASGVAVPTNTTNSWNNSETHVLRINVSASGVVAYLIDGVAPVVTHAFTFAPATVVSPCLVFIHGVAVPSAMHLISVKAGLQ